MRTNGAGQAEADEAQDLEEREPETPEAEAPDQAEATEDGGWEWPDGYRIDGEGRHFDADGNELPADLPPQPEEADSGSRAQEPPAPTPAAPPAPQPAGQIRTRENAFTENEQAQLAQLDIENPTQAASMRFERFRQVDNWAQDRFDDQMDTLQQEAPELVQRYERQVSRLRRNMTPEQLQTPGAARTVVALVIAQDLASKPSLRDGLRGLLAEEPAVPAKKTDKQQAPARREPIPPAERMPRPSGARRGAPQATSQGGRGSLTALYKSMYPDMSDADIADAIKSKNAMEEEAGRR